MNLEYYVYAYVRGKDSETAPAGTPYYIGKGKKDRAFKKYSGIFPPNDKSRIIFLETKLSEIGAFAIERKMIRWYGRKDLGTGILLNKTDGGEGSYGIVVTEETRRKMSLASKGKPKSEEHIRNNSKAQTGKIISKESIEKGRLSRLGKPSKLKGKSLSEETKRKMSISHKGKKQQIIICPHCNKSGGYQTMPRWHFNNCKLRETK